MKNEKSAFAQAREKAKSLTSDSSELDGRKSVACTESSMNLEQNTSLGWQKKQAVPIATSGSIVLTSAT